MEYPRDRFEIIVVDDGSEMALEPVVAPYYSLLDITLISQARTGPAAARNRGAAQAGGEILAFTDDDCLPAPDWLSQLAVRFQQSPHHAVGGQTINALVENPFSTTSQLLVNYLYSYYNSTENQPRFFTSNNLAMPTDAFRAIGGFNRNFPLAAAEDRELCDRWQHCGFQMTYAPEVLVYHVHALTLHSFWQQHFNYGRGAYFFHKVRSQRYHEKIKLEPGTFYRNLILFPLNQATDQRAILTMTLLMKSQFANAAGFGWEFLRAAHRRVLGHKPQPLSSQAQPE